MNKDSCGTCRYWKAGDPTIEEHMVCKRYPPILDMNYFDATRGARQVNPTVDMGWYIFPMTKKDDWCGEYIFQI